MFSARDHHWRGRPPPRMQIELVTLLQRQKMEHQATTGGAPLFSNNLLKAWRIETPYSFKFRMAFKLFVGGRMKLPEQGRFHDPKWAPSWFSLCGRTWCEPAAVSFQICTGKHYCFLWKDISKILTCRMSLLVFARQPNMAPRLSADNNPPVPDS